MTVLCVGCYSDSAGLAEVSWTESSNVLLVVTAIMSVTLTVLCVGCYSDSAGLVEVTWTENNNVLLVVMAIMSVTFTVPVSYTHLTLPTTRMV